MKDDVQSIDDLIAKLREMKYIVTYGKYISVRSPKAKHGIRTFRLGDGYALEELKYRIANKEQEMSIEKAMSYQGIQREYALCLRQMQILVYRHVPYPRKVTIREVRRNAEMLQYICEKKIRTEEDFKNLVDESSKRYNDLKNRQETLKADIEETQNIIASIPEYLRLMTADNMTDDEEKKFESMGYMHRFRIRSVTDISKFKEKLKSLNGQESKLSEDLEIAESENRTVSAFYENYLRTVQTDYDILLERAKREYAETAEREERRLAENLKRDESEKTADVYYRR